MAGAIQVTVNDTLARWERGLGSMNVGPQALAVWSQAIEVMYGRTQEKVHVWKTNGGTLKASGSVAMSRDSTSVSGTITYDAPYAIYEMARGGEHDFMTIAFKETDAMFRASLGTAIDALLSFEVG